MFGSIRRLLSRNATNSDEAVQSALEARLGPMADLVGHAPVPLELGGFADVGWFSSNPDGVYCATIELTKNAAQVFNALGRYELVIKTPEHDDVAANLISRLGRYTLEARLEPGQTMDIGGVPPEGSTISALYFYDFGKLDVPAGPAGLLMCVGLTPAELDSLHRNRRDQVLDNLRTRSGFPMTDWYRASVV